MTHHRNQPITPMMTDEEADAIVRRSMIVIDAIGFIALIAICIMIWVAVPA